LPEIDQKEKHLIEKAKDGDRHAFEELAKSCAAQVYNLAYRLSGNSQAAEDISQEAFLNAYRNIKKFEHKCPFAGWIYRITINVWKIRVRYEKRRFFTKHDSLDEIIETEDGETKREITDTSDDPGKEFDKKYKSETIEKALSELNNEARVMIILRDMQEKSYEEIAEITEIPLGTVKSRIARARESLREKFNKYLEV